MVSTEKSLADRVAEGFLRVERPSSIFSWQDLRREKEFLQLERIDWEHAGLNNFDDIYEPNTFINSLGYQYLFPRVYSFCKRFGSAVEAIDFVESFYITPCLGSGNAKKFELFSTQQKTLAWEVYLQLIEDDGLEFFHDWGAAKEILRSILLPK